MSEYQALNKLSNNQNTVKDQTHFPQKQPQYGLTNYMLAATAPHLLSPQDILQLQSTLGNQAVMQLFKNGSQPHSMPKGTSPFTVIQSKLMNPRSFSEENSRVIYNNTGNQAAGELIDRHASSPAPAAQMYFKEKHKPIWPYKDPKTILSALEAKGFPKTEQSEGNILKAAVVRDSDSKHIAVDIKSQKSVWNSLTIDEEEGAKAAAKEKSPFKTLTSICEQFSDSNKGDQEYQALSLDGSKEIMVARNKTADKQGATKIPSIEEGHKTTPSLTDDYITVLNGDAMEASAKNTHAEITLLAKLVDNMLSTQSIPVPKLKYKLAGTKWPCDKCLPIVKGFKEASSDYFDVNYDFKDTSKRKIERHAAGAYKNPLADMKGQVAEIPAKTSEDAEPKARFKDWCTSILAKDVVWQP